MKTWFPPVVLSLIAGIGLGAWMAGPEPEPQASVPVSLDVTAPVVTASVAVEDASAIDRLVEELEQARTERKALAEEVASLRAQWVKQEARIAKAETRSDGDHAGGGDRTGHGGRSAQPRGLDVDALVEAGFPERDVRGFKDRMDQVELDRLYLRDIASREGWLDTPRFREQNEALSLDYKDTREEYGEEFYDWMLYTTGHSNRIQVGDVMGGSAADSIGLRPGDLIVSYGGEKIYMPSDLRSRTSEGEAGVATEIEVVRDGRSMRLEIPRGPLGIRVEGASVEPDPVR